jgi:hypothetical protein
MARRNESRQSASQWTDTTESVREDWIYLEVHCRLRGAANGRQPSKQEEMVAAKRAAIGPQYPVDGLLQYVANAYASKIN